MKISKELWMQEGIGYEVVDFLKDNHKTPKTVYIVCTSYHKDLLFDIVESYYITSKYNECYVVAVTKTKKEAIKQIRRLVDELYNLKTKDYEKLKVE